MHNLVVLAFVSVEYVVKTRNSNTPSIAGKIDNDGTKRTKRVPVVGVSGGDPLLSRMADDGRGVMSRRGFFFK